MWLSIKPGTTVLSVAVCAVMFVYVYFGQQLQIDMITDEISDKTTELESVKDIDKYLTIQNQLAALPALHEGKGEYSRVFDFLEVINPSAPNNVYLTKLAVASSDTSITFNGKTATFESLNVFVDTLKNENGSKRMK